MMTTNGVLNAKRRKVKKRPPQQKASLEKHSKKLSWDSKKVGLSLSPNLQISKEFSKKPQIGFSA